jgi:hypothetical protein
MFLWEALQKLVYCSRLVQMQIQMRMQLKVYKWRSSLVMWFCKQDQISYGLGYFS